MMKPARFFFKVFTNQNIDLNMIDRRIKYLFFPNTSGLINLGYFINHIITNWNVLNSMSIKDTIFVWDYLIELFDITELGLEGSRNSYIVWLMPEFNGSLFNTHPIFLFDIIENIWEWRGKICDTEKDIIINFYSRGYFNYFNSSSFKDDYFSKLPQTLESLGLSNN